MRQIEPKMTAFLDKKLALNGAAQEAIKNKDARSLMVYAAEACVGIREEGGNNRGPMVKLIQETIGGADGEAWCMSFVQTCIAYAEVKTGVKSPLPAGEHCMTVFNEAPKSSRVKTFPARGAVIIWKHGKGPAGHTGFFLEADGNQMKTIEGNTESGLDSRGNVERDGGGVYHGKRSMVKNGTMVVQGFLKPF
jgi:CHAP domain